jgi:hypothetical protein
MVSRSTIDALEQRGFCYILGARMRAFKEVRLQVLSRAGRYHVVKPPRARAHDPSPLKVKEVKVEGRRYVVCCNEEQRRKDAADREAILEGLRKALREGDRKLVGNKGFRKYVRVQGEGFAIDEGKARSEARYDGKWVLRTSTDWTSDEVALTYKQLWMVEAMFRTAKTVLSTRPVYHQRDDTIRGHVFCSFLALLLRYELQRRLEEAGHGALEWDDVIRDLEQLTLMRVEHDAKRFVLRSETRGSAGKVCQAVGVALPPSVRCVATQSPP